MKIEVNQDIFAGSVGDWQDGAAAQASYAEALEKAYRTYLEEHYPTATIIIHIGTPREIEGYSSCISCDITNSDNSSPREQSEIVEELKRVGLGALETWADGYCDLHGSNWREF